ncbi:hypothetical protein LNTAR_19115 [Lentisphaera araneosa HTCC2155]|uniref:Uncharacterized protein n=1 Tax=Lentisphaera araneosa HTCC2155 TaxID=313628 RepID=A6DNX9_9BACT|nr:glycoside hydrolase family protein [Lentisphaera araneosa]EDM26788.1 hypothetical protein LNTAR_19115 [Lentisphaera araneosa HTCC2155]
MKNLKILTFILLSLLTSSLALAEQKSVFNHKQTDTLDLKSKIQKVTDDNIFRDANACNWGSSIIKGEDGKYHIFYAQMLDEFSFSSWLTDGVISHAVSDSPAGPYKHKEVVLKGRGLGHWDAYTAHNPRIKFYDGKYYLYYISTNTGDRVLSKDQMNQARHGKLGDEFRNLVRENQRIGVAVSDSINGPWKRFDKPLIEPSLPIVNITCNPAITKRPDGGYLMFVRGDKPNQKKLVRSQAVALADSPTGPWKILPKPAVGNLNSEDPFVWYDQKRMRYYAVYHAFGYMAMITSEDGINWKKAKHYKVTKLSYDRHDGKAVDAARMERPFIFIEDGVPKVLSVAILERSGRSYSLFIPLEDM